MKVIESLTSMQVEIKKDEGAAVLQSIHITPSVFGEPYEVIIEQEAGGDMAERSAFIR